MIPIVLGVSVFAFASESAIGANPLDNAGYSYAPPHCTTTYSSTNLPPASLTIMTAGTYCFTSGETFNTQITVGVGSVTLTSTGGPQMATIQPTTLAATSTVPVSAEGAIVTAGSPEYNIILVGGGASPISGVAISNLIVDGSKVSSPSGSAIFNGCGDEYEGVLFLNGGGAITGTTVQNILLPQNLAGCQPGEAILVQTPCTDFNSVTDACTSTTDSSVVNISNDQALNYNKNGITCNDSGTTCSIASNTVNFYDQAVLPSYTTSYSNFIAPNGIQVGFGAVGMVDGNTVMGNQCNLGYPTGVCGPNLLTQTASCGILTYQSGAGTEISNNMVGGRDASQSNDLGICSASDKATVAVNGNSFQGNRVAAIYEDDGAYTVSNNQVSGSPIGVAVVSDGFSATATSSTLSNNNFNGRFSIALVEAMSLSGGSYGGPNAPTPAVNLSLDGLAESVSGGTSSSPSIVNITSTPQQGFGGFGP